MIRINPLKYLAEFGFEQLSNNIFKSDFITLNIFEDTISDSVIISILEDNTEITHCIATSEEEFINHMDLIIYINNVIAKKGVEYFKSIL